MADRERGEGSRTDEGATFEIGAREFGPSLMVRPAGTIFRCGADGPGEKEHVFDDPFGRVISSPITWASSNSGVAADDVFPPLFCCLINNACEFIVVNGCEFHARHPPRRRPSSMPS